MAWSARLSTFSTKKKMFTHVCDLSGDALSNTQLELEAMDDDAAQLEKASGAESDAASSGLAATAASMAAAGFLAM